MARPTTDTAKENLFNILANYFDFSQIRVLDLFGGTGSISLEFASRGALSVDLVEINKRYTDFIQKNIDRMKLEQLAVNRSDAFVFIRNTPDKYDIIFADPPYDMKGIEGLPDEISAYELLAENGWFILEHGRDQNFSDHPSYYDMRKYGSVHFSIFT